MPFEPIFEGDDSPQLNTEVGDAASQDSLAGMDLIFQNEDGSISSSKPKLKIEPKYSQPYPQEKTEMEKDVGPIGSFLVDTIPFMKYALPTRDQEWFKQLTEEERMKLLTHEAFGLALWVGGPVVLAGAGKLAVKGGKALLKAKKVKALPIEDALSGIEAKARRYTFRPFNYEAKLSKALSGRGFGKDEVPGMVESIMSGSGGPLKNVRLGKTLAETKFSKAWMKSVIPSGEAYGGLRVAPSLMAQVSKRTLRKAHWKAEYRQALRKEVFGGTEPPKEIAELALRRESTRLWGEEFGNLMKTDWLDEFRTANIIRTMMDDRSVIRGWMSPKNFSSLKPIRVALGFGEEAFGTYSKIYQPITQTMRTAYNYIFHATARYNLMLEQRGLGKVIWKSSGEFRFKPNFDYGEAQAAFKAITRRDEVMMRGGDKAILRKEAEAIKELLSPKAKELVNSWDDFSNTLYAEFSFEKLRQVFEKMGLTQFGQNQVDLMMKEVGPKIFETFATSTKVTDGERLVFMKDVLKGARSKLQMGEGITRHPWFRAQGKALQKQMANLRKELNMSKGYWPKYLENYSARFSSHGDSLRETWKGMLTKGEAARGRAGFTKERTLKSPVDTPQDLATMIEGRIRAQSKELFVYDDLHQVVKHAQGLPQQWRTLVQHFVNRAMGHPSNVDFMVARGLERAFKWLKPSATWDEHRVMRLAQSINNMTYMGGLGFKPFSAMRNLFQPLVTVPADLGGMKSYGDLLVGMKRFATDKSTREYLQRIGIITEYAPEITVSPKALPFGKAFKFRGGFKTLPQSDSVRDMAMFMFRGSDRWNRYVTGGAAMNKWEKAFGRFVRRNKTDTKLFLKDSGTSIRNPWVKAEIEDNVRRGLYDDAKAMFVRDVVADTQYLYGSLDSPLITTKAGIISRTGLIFQSWWMNYASLLGKFMRTGDAGTKANRMFTWMSSSSIAYMIMTQMWDKKVAQKSVGLGPFIGPTTVSEFSIPPAWTPVYHAVRTIINAPIDQELSGQQAKRFLLSLPVLAPGGLQIKQMAQAGAKEGVEGTLRSIIRLKNPEDED